MRLNIVFTQVTRMSRLYIVVVGSFGVEVHFEYMMYGKRKKKIM